ncbi:hemin uptake protein HemP [Guyparkeria halophila]|uniref:Hemin uptake protein HemP n=1 Tax=Guyparkeria halophila TaxID=47960 RepID=A0ABZ0YXF8_9GAMM|nr:hemin uptake protein HemP [Guyparkeria halophila]WQH16845.1 hemin uptake protein HemP [Guyparkeria halophila]
MNDINRPAKPPAPPSAADRQPPDGERCIDSQHLMSPDGQCWICHDGQRYQLRITAANKLILTK